LEKMMTSISADTRAAIDGGAPAKSVPYTRQPKFGPEELEQLKEALDQGTLFYFFGKKVSALEKAFAEKHGAAHAISTSSGTASIHAALIAAGVSPGDEVIVSPITDMGSIGPILWQGGVPVFADVHPTRHVMTAETVRAVISEKTKAVIAVHLWGNPADPLELRQICDERGITLIEDCAQAYGCKQHGRAAGTIGHMGAFSLNDFKHISAGDGGMVLTDDDMLATRLRLATDKGYSRAKDAAERNPTFLCNNYRMTELQGAVGLAQIAKLDSIIERRQAWCSELSARLEGIPGLILPEPTAGADVSWWFYMFRVNPAKLGATADEFGAALQAEQVPVGVHYIGRCVYEYPIFLNHSAFENGQHPYQAVEYQKGMCPAAEDLLANCLILPINEGFTRQDLEETVEAFQKAVAWANGKR
jgi:dTDP-4-amino-4,6-dideoxygalactose transaminase